MEAHQVGRNVMTASYRDVKHEAQPGAVSADGLRRRTGNWIEAIPAATGYRLAEVPLVEVAVVQWASGAEPAVF
ncbi:hypothetical protein NLG97_g6738 [Lecanicillium saksenae]|uniref:Uncharacterized protein n=1 Tax=Lecanicillium saksenae TaxID=468837 RepID=A0ACC1QQ31_9HYPO|nr:hypothetical protein NLG97_g6738 [Lecanicillium saksenae]